MRRLRILIGMAIIALVLGIFYISNTKNEPTPESDFKVTKFENIYEGKNIKFYYDNLGNISYTNLRQKYKIDDGIFKGKDNIKKLSLLSDWIKGEDREDNKVKVKSSAQYLIGDEKSVLSDAFEKGFANEKDFNTVFAVMARALGFQTRIVEFYQKTDSKMPTLLTLTEVYFENLNKWVLYDAVNDTIFSGKEPLSGIEVVESGLSSVKNLKSGDKYIKKYGKYFDDIRIPIDSRVYDHKKFNGFLMYVKKDKIPQMVYTDIEIDATIFTKNTEMFSYIPGEESDIRDSIPTLIFSMEEEKENKKKDQEAKIILYGSAFKDSSNLKSFYIRINDEEYKEVDENFKYEITKGTKIKIYLSEDGENTLREVEFQF